jgi:hypothetical protein
LQVVPESIDRQRTTIRIPVGTADRMVHDYDVEGVGVQIREADRAVQFRQPPPRSHLHILLSTGRAKNVASSPATVFERGRKAVRNDLRVIYDRTVRFKFDTDSFEVNIRGER